MDGTIVRRCPTDKPLYCSRAGKFYSVHNRFRNNRSSESEIRNNRSSASEIRTGASKPCGEYLTDDGWVLHEIKPCFAVPKNPKVCHTRYPFMRRFGNRTCHMLMALTWIGPRPEGYQCDHINGDILNWSADNLQYVTPAENRKRAKLLRVLRSIGRDPKQMSREELLSIFEKYEFSKRPADA